jgi:hypothetical protein
VGRADRAEFSAFALARSGVLALRDPSADKPTISLLTCHVSSNDCQVTVADAGTYTDLALPVGEALGD